MSDLSLSLDNLKGNVKQLIELHQQLKSDNEQLKADNQNLSTELEEQKSHITELEDVIIGLKTKEKEEEETGKKTITDSKIKIDELVHEIDNCIALLK